MGVVRVLVGLLLSFGAVAGLIAGPPSFEEGLALVLLAGVPGFGSLAAEFLTGRADTCQKSPPSSLGCALSTVFVSLPMTALGMFLIVYGWAAFANGSTFFGGWPAGDLRHLVGGLLIGPVIGLAGVLHAVRVWSGRS